MSRRDQVLACAAFARVFIDAVNTNGETERAAMQLFAALSYLPEVVNRFKEDSYETRNTVL